ncbi:MAG: GNAT family N-acetyltransferase [Tannerellaceae bacterium]|jgi:GNAT superfamily N-acetyltransferase|nr:GNAT family N-acetyltransferase [Tannerellaceae bacterium]
MKKKKKQIIKLWKTVFSDSNKFIHLYFKQVYKDENALTIEKDGQVVSALQMLPYRMSFCGEEIAVAYISGACTLPSEQGKGWMSLLLQNAFAEMKKREIALSVLIPAEKWLFQYYRARGYTEIFEYSLKIYSRNEYILPDTSRYAIQLKKVPDETLYGYFDRKLRERPMGILHSYEDFGVILRDLDLSDGKFFVAYKADGQPAGMAFVFLPETTAEDEDGSVLIKEFLYDNELVKTHLLYEISKRFHVPKVVYRAPIHNGQVTYPYGMARVIDSERLIKLWATTHPDSKLSVNEMRSMSLQALTAHLFAYSGREAYMSLMLD